MYCDFIVQQVVSFTHLLEEMLCVTLMCRAGAGIAEHA